MTNIVVLVEISFFIFRLYNQNKHDDSTRQDHEGNVT
jgi:hypothetical protein